MRTKITLKDAIEIVLNENGPLKCQEIADIIKRRKLAQLGGKTPVNTVYSCVSTTPEMFVSVKPGVYGLKKSGLRGSTVRIAKAGGVRSGDNVHPMDYQYTERFVGGEEERYWIKLDALEGVFCRNYLLLKTLKKEFVGSKFTKDEFPCVYALITDIVHKKVYVGETNEILVRIRQWEKTEEIYTRSSSHRRAAQQRKHTEKSRAGDDGIV